MGVQRARQRRAEKSCEHGGSKRGGGRRGGEGEEHWRWGEKEVGSRQCPLLIERARCSQDPLGRFPVWQHPGAEEEEEEEFILEEEEGRRVYGEEEEGRRRRRRRRLLPAVTGEASTTRSRAQEGRRMARGLRCLSGVPAQPEPGGSLYCQQKRRNAEDAALLSGSSRGRRLSIDQVCRAAFSRRRHATASCACLSSYRWQQTPPCPPPPPPPSRAAC